MPRERVARILRALDPDGAFRRWRQTLKRREYKVRLAALLAGMLIIEDFNTTAKILLLYSFLIRFSAPSPSGTAMDTRSSSKNMDSMCVSVDGPPPFA